MIHPDTQIQFISEEIGFGVVATKLIPAGTITWVLDSLDQEFTQTEFEAMGSAYQEILDIYSYRNKEGHYILCWDNGRFVNHSFNSNCLTTAYDFEIAIRDIQPGEQLTDDYGYLNISEPFEGIDEGTDRKVVYPDDLKNFHGEWDAKLLKVFNKIPDLKQPLKHILADGQWETVLRVKAGEDQMKSILENFYAENA